MGRIRMITAAMVVSALCLAPAGAAAGTALTSEPLKGGPGGVVCACSNLSKSPIVINLLLQSANGGTNCTNQTVTPLIPASCPRGTPIVHICIVTRADGKSASAKRLACSLAALDADGNPTAVVRLDQKLKQ